MTLQTYDFIIIYSVIGIVEYSTLITINLTAYKTASTEDVCCPYHPMGCSCTATDPPQFPSRKPMEYRMASLELLVIRANLFEFSSQSF